MWKKYQNTCVGNYEYNKVLFYRVATQKREIVLFLKEYLKNLGWIQTLSPQMKIEILRGLFGSERSVGEGKLKEIRVSYGQKEGKNLKILKRLLSDFSINFYEWKDKEEVVHLDFRKRKAAKLYFLFNGLTIKRHDRILKRWLVEGYFKKDIQKIRTFYFNFYLIEEV